MNAERKSTVRVEISPGVRAIYIGGERLDISFDDDPGFAAFCERLCALAIQHLASTDGGTAAQEDLRIALEKVETVISLKRSLDERRTAREHESARRSEMNQLRSEMVASGKATLMDVDQKIFEMPVHGFREATRSFPHLYRVDFRSVSGLLMLT